MVNPEHLEIAKSSETIKEWVLKNPNKQLDLTNGNFRNTTIQSRDFLNCDLSGADFTGCVLHSVNFVNSNLQNTEFFSSNLYKISFGAADLNNSSFWYVGGNQINFSGCLVNNANFCSANFITSDFSRIIGKNLNIGNCVFANCSFQDAFIEESDLSLSYLSSSNFSNAKISKCDLIGSTFLRSNLSGTNFDFPEMGATCFSACDFSKTVGLKTVKHSIASCIDIQTLHITFYNSGFSYTDDLRLFFSGAGIPNELIQSLPKIFAKVKYSTCFISYGNPDVKFAEKLATDLRLRGVSCWLYSLDSTPGAATWKEISTKREEAEKMIILCSLKSLCRPAVKKEIEEQIDETPEKIIPVSLDNDWKQEGFEVKRDGRDLKSFLLNRNYADFTDLKRYMDSLERLLKGLEKAK